MVSLSRRTETYIYYKIILSLMSSLEFDPTNITQMDGFFFSFAINVEKYKSID